MNRQAWAVAALILLTVPLAPRAVGEASPRLVMYCHAPQETPAPARGLLVLDSNVSANLSTHLLAPSLPEPHSLERVNLTIVYRQVRGAAANVTVDVVGTGDGARLPDVCLWGTDPGRRDYTTANCTYSASYFNLQLRPANPLFIVRIRCDGDLVVLRWNDQLLPARVLLRASLVLPEGQTYLPELHRARASVVIANEGGLDAIDQVVDVRYAGRIVVTWTVPLVPANGSYAVPIDFVPVRGEREIEVHLVSGEGAPYRIAVLPVDVRDSARLSVDWVKVDRARIEEGARLRVTARVSNAGNLTAVGELVQFLVDGGVVANATPDGLGPGNSTTVTGIWQATGPGTHAVSARVEDDPLGAQAASVRVTAQAPMPGAALAVLAVAVAVAPAALRRAGRR